MPKKAVVNRCATCEQLQQALLRTEAALEECSQRLATVRTSLAVQEQTAAAALRSADSNAARVKQLEAELAIEKATSTSRQEETRHSVVTAQERLVSAEHDVRVAMVKGKAAQEDLFEARHRISELEGELHRKEERVRAGASAHESVALREHSIRIELASVCTERDLFKQRLDDALAELETLNASKVAIEVKELRGRVKVLQAGADAHAAYERQLTQCRYVLSGGRGR